MVEPENLYFWFTIGLSYKRRPPQIYSKFGSGVSKSHTIFHQSDEIYGFSIANALKHSPGPTQPRILSFQLPLEGCERHSQTRMSFEAKM